MLGFVIFNHDACGGIIAPFRFPDWHNLQFECNLIAFAGSFALLGDAGFAEAVFVVQFDLGVDVGADA